MAGGDLDIQNVSQPQEISKGRIDSIARFKGGRNVERITDRYDDEGGGTNCFDRGDPESQ